MASRAEASVASIVDEKRDELEKKENESSFLQCGILREAALKEVFMDDERVEQHCTPLSWSNIDASTFSVRHGPNYKKSGKKGPSQQALYDVFAMDTYQSPIKVKKMSQFVDLTQHINRVSNESDSQGSEHFGLLPPILIVNFLIPNYSASMMGQDKTDGEGFSLVFYCQMSKHVSNALSQFSQNKCEFEELPSSVRLLSKFVSAADSRNSNQLNPPKEQRGEQAKHSSKEQKEKEKEKKKKKKKKGNETNGDFEFDNRFDLSQKEIERLLSKFKVIVRTMNFSQTSLAHSMKPIMKQYNGKPFIAKTSTTFYYEPKKYFAIDVDAHVFGKFARKSLGYVRKNMESIILDGAFVVQGEQDSELPEQILCSARVSKVSAKSAKQFPPALLKQYQARKQDNLHTSHKYDVNSTYCQQNRDKEGRQ